MVWRYPDRHTTEANGSEGIKVAQDQRLVQILTLLDEALSNRSFLLGANISACDHFLFMLALWCGKISQPPMSFANLRRFMGEMCQRTAVQQVCEFENIDLGPYRK